MSLPSTVVGSPLLAEVCDTTAQCGLEQPGCILRDEKESREDIGLNGPPTPYWDPILANHSEAYASFARDLHARGMATFGRVPEIL